MKKQPQSISCSTLNPINWGADPSGVSGSSAQINSCIDYAPDGSRIEFPEGTYRLDAPVAWSGKRLELHGRGRVVFLQSFTLNEPMVLAERASGSQVVNFEFIGTDNATFYDANFNEMARLYQSLAALRFNDSDDVWVDKLRISRKVVGVCIATCHHSIIDNVRFTGFGSDILCKPNFHAGLLILQGENNSLRHLVFDNGGNAILVGRYRADTATCEIPIDTRILHPHITNAADNAIYLSSAQRVEVMAPTVLGCHSSGVRIQGDFVTITGGYLFDCGAGISIQGLETSAIIDCKWAGRGTTISGTVIENNRSAGILLDDRSNSGCYTRDNCITDVLVIGGSPKGGIFGTADYSIITNLRVVNPSGPGIRLAGAGSSSVITDFVIDEFEIINAGNIGVLLTDATKSLVTNGRLTKSVNTYNNFLTAIRVTDSDFMSIRSDIGRASEDASSTRNLFANIQGAAPNVLDGTSHRLWTVAQ